MNYFFENDNVSMLDVNLNFHYLFPVASKVKLYPLLGLTFSNWMFDWNDDWDVDIHGNHVHIGGDDDSDNGFRFDMNIGGGVDFAIARNRMMNIEFRHQLVSDFDQAVFNLGFAYRF